MESLSAPWGMSQQTLLLDPGQKAFPYTLQVYLFKKIMHD